MPNQPPRKSGPIDAPPGSERLTARQIAIAKQRRREGASLNEISDQMGISKETVFRHTRGITPKPQSDGVTVEAPAGRPVVTQNNGGEAPKVELTKPSIINIGVELDPELMLMLSGAAYNEGYTGLRSFLTEFALPWLKTIGEAKKLLGSTTPNDHVAKLEAVVKGYVAWKDLMRKAGEGEKPNVVASDGSKTGAS